MIYYETVTVETTESGSQINFESGSAYNLKASAIEAEYIGKKLRLLGQRNSELMMSITYDHRKIADEIDSVIETTPKQIATARGQIEDSRGIVDNYSDLDIAIMDFQMRSMIAEKAMEIDDPWNQPKELRWRNQIAVDYPDFDFS